MIHQIDGNIIGAYYLKYFYKVDFCEGFNYTKTNMLYRQLSEHFYDMQENIMKGLVKI